MSIKRILFITSGLTHGGVNKSLQNLLRVIDPKKYQIDVFSIYRSGPYGDAFKEYNLIPAISTSFLAPFFCMRTTAKSKKWTDLLTKIHIHFFKKRYLNIVAGRLSENGYDVVVSFQEGFTTVLAASVETKKHIAWIHCDYSRYLANKKKEETKLYELFDNIVCVSNYTASVFKSIISSVSKKVVAIHNVIDDSYILELSKIPIGEKEMDNNVFSLISVGRMDPVKRFSYIPRISKQLKGKGLTFNWYIIGSGGSEEKLIRQEIIKNSVEDSVHLLGTKDNPYQYMNKCSILVCPSSSEACPNVINEAMILRVPVIAADFPSAKEFINNGENGIVCDIEKTANQIEMFYLETDTTKKVKKTIEQFKFDNEASLKEIYQLFDE